MMVKRVTLVLRQSKKVRLKVETPQRNLLLSQIFTAIFISIVNSVANWYTRFEKSGIPIIPDSKKIFSQITASTSHVFKHIIGVSMGNDRRTLAPEIVSLRYEKTVLSLPSFPPRPLQIFRWSMVVFGSIFILLLALK